MNIWPYLCGVVILAAALLIWSLCRISRYGYVQPVRPDTGEYDSGGER